MLADETGLEIAVCHFPPGTSKWATSSTGCSPPSPSTGGASPWSATWSSSSSSPPHHPHGPAGAQRAQQRVRSALNTGRYPKGVRVGDAEMEALYLEREAFHGDWDYTLVPRERLPMANAVVS
jgi:hypothetical protein